MPLPKITLIESRRVRLRPVAETDLPALLEINGDPQQVIEQRDGQTGDAGEQNLI